jgi:PAS domain S-box-containing protein
MAITAELAAPRIISRADEIFTNSQQAIYKHTDRMFCVLMLVQWVAGIIAALWISPRSWNGSSSQIHIHVWFAIFLGGVISSVPVALAVLRPGAPLTRYTVAIAQMCYSALFIHLSGGRIETHFHVFGSLAFLSIYRDWRVLVPATVVVALDHFIRGTFWPQSVFGVLAVNEWRWLEHSGWVLFEDAFLLFAMRKSVSEMRHSSEQTAAVEVLNATLEKRVTDRTKALNIAVADLTEEVSERQRAEVELVDQKAFLRQVIDLNPSFIFAKDLEGRFTLVNQTLADAYGSTVEQLLGRTDTDFNPNAEMTKRWRDDDLEVVSKRREKFVPEEMVTDAAGNVRWLQTNKRPIISSGGEVTQILGVATDITQRKDLEEKLNQAQKMEAIGKLAGGVAHDFNNLLTGIIGYSDLAFRRVGAEDRVRSNLEEIKKAATRAASLTQQLLAFSRKQMLQAKELDLNSVVEDMATKLGRLTSQDIKLITVLAPSLGKIKGDPNQIEQTIMHLVVNAIEAMPNGGTVTIETASVFLDEAYASKHLGAQVGPHVMLAVTDTGIGMTAELQKRVFEPFFTTKEVGKGAGLGLSAVYGVVKQTGGNIWLYSEPNKGTVLKIYFPEVEDTAAIKAADVDAADGNETILLVDDDPQIRKVACEALTARGYRVLLASNGLQALETVEKFAEHLDLILTDLVIPNLNGKELAQRIWAFRPATKVLFMSGFTREAAVTNRVLSNGAWFIEKPFALSVLAAKVREVLDAGSGSGQKPEPRKHETLESETKEKVTEAEPTVSMLVN